MRRLSSALPLVLLAAGLALWNPELSVASAAPRLRPVRRPPAFANPERVTIVGWSEAAMEPALTRDGRYLLFNNSNAPDVDTNLHYAERVDDTTFVYRGEIAGVNTPALEGVPSVDAQGTFYFVSTQSYATTLSTIYRGRFAGGSVTGVELVGGVSLLKPGMVNFDAEISRDGQTLYLVDGLFGGGAVPMSADLTLASNGSAGFVRTADGSLFAAVNTSALEYAPSVSADERELFFTRLEYRDGIPISTIWQARRGGSGLPFGPPSRIESIDSFAEAPALSPDERSLYFHRLEGSTFAIYRVTR